MNAVHTTAFDLVKYSSSSGSSRNCSSNISSGSISSSGGGSSSSSSSSGSSGGGGSGGCSSSRSIIIIISSSSSSSSRSSSSSNMIFVIFEALTAVAMQFTVFWDVMQCSLVNSYHSFDISILLLSGPQLHDNSSQGTFDSCLCVLKETVEDTVHRESFPFQQNYTNTSTSSLATRHSSYASKQVIRRAQF